MNRKVTVQQLVDALRTIGCEGPATAADVLDQVDTGWPREIRDHVLRAMAQTEDHQVGRYSD